MAVLFDQNGRPLMREKLLQEEAMPSLSGVRSIMTGNPTIGIDPGRMARIMLDANEGNALSYLEMAEEIEEKDAHFMAVMGTRKRAVSQLEVTVEAASEDPADEDNAEMCRDLLNRDELQSELFDMLDAIGKGYSVTEMIWDITADLWTPVELKWRDPRWFQFDRIDGRTLRLRDGGVFRDLEPYKYIVHTHKAKSGIPIRGGVIRACAWMWLFKNFSVKDWITFAEAYGQPIRIGKYGPGASKEDREVLLRAVANIGSDAGAIIPESMLIEFVESQQKTSSVDVFERLTTFCDTQMSKAVLGQTTTTDAIAAGMAGNQAHNDVRADIEKSDAMQLSATLTKQLLVPFITLNKGPQKKYPRLRIGRTEDVDIAKLAQTANTAVRMGIKVSESKMRDQLGLPAPENDGDTIVPLPEASPPPFLASSLVKGITASVDQSHRLDAIDGLADELASGWRETLDPMVTAIEEAVKASSNYEEFSEKLLEIAGDLNITAAAEQIAKAVFATRVAGNLGVKL